MRDIIIRGIDKVVGDGTLTSDEEMQQSHRKGAIVAHVEAGVETPSRHLTGLQVSPRWIVIRSDVTSAEVDSRMEAWPQDLDWALTSLNTALDSWHGDLGSVLFRSSDGYGMITQGQAENYLLAWSLSNLVFTSNSAAGDFTIFDLATSDRFWARDTTPFGFTELAYDESSGRHDIRLDYSSLAGDNDAKVLAEVEARAEAVTQDTGSNTIDYAIWRGIPDHTPIGREERFGDDMIKTLKTAVREELDARLGLKRWRIKPAVVDAVINPPNNGYGEATPSELLGFLQEYRDL